VAHNADATVNGTLSPAFAGATIDLTFTNGQGTSFQRTATTNDRGDWSHVFDTETGDPPNSTNGDTWTVSAHYPGDSTHDASATQTCTFKESSG
jgi:hypothetical protein